MLSLYLTLCSCLWKFSYKHWDLISVSIMFKKHFRQTYKYCKVSMDQFPKASLARFRQRYISMTFSYAIILFYLWQDAKTYFTLYIIHGIIFQIWFYITLNGHIRNVPTEKYNTINTSLMSPQKVMSDSSDLKY